MASENVERKLTMILATDVVGYSTKMEKNEVQTLQEKTYQIFENAGISRLNAHNKINK